jgi:hypothetical protein
MLNADTWTRVALGRHYFRPGAETLKKRSMRALLVEFDLAWVLNLSVVLGRDDRARSLPQ